MRGSSLQPAATDLYTRGRDHFVLDFGDFSGGLCKTKRPQQLEDNQAWEIVNFFPSRDSRGNFNGWRTRDGLTKVSSTTQSSNVLSGVTFKGELVSATSSAVYHGSTKISNINGRCQLVDAGNYLLIMDGHYLKYWDGTDFGLCYDKSGYVVDNRTVTTTSTANLTASGAMATVEFTMPAFDPVASTANSIPWVSTTVKLSAPGTLPIGYVEGVVCNSSGSVLYTSNNQVDCVNLVSSAVSWDFDFSASSIATSGVTYRVGVRFVGTASASQYVGVDIGDAGVGSAIVFDGTTWSTIAGKTLVGSISPGLPPKARIGRSWQRRIFLSPGDSQYVYYNHAGDINDWSTAGVFNNYVFDQDSGNVVGIESFAKDILIIFRGGTDASGNALHKSVWRLQGSSASSMSTYFIVDGISAIGEQAYSSGGNNVYFLDSGGVYRLFTTDRYGDASFGAIDGNVTTILEGNVGDNSVLSYDTRRGHLYVWGDGGDSGVPVPYYLTYDVFLGIWWKTDFNGIDEGTVFSSNGDFYVADTDVYKLSSSAYLDDTVLPNVEFRTKFHYVGSPFQLKESISYLIDMYTTTGGSLKVTVCKDLEMGGYTSWDVEMSMADIEWTEATMEWTTATWPWSPVSGSMLPVKNRKMHFSNIMIGLSDFVYTTSPVYLNGIYVEGHLMKRRT